MLRRHTPPFLALYGLAIDGAHERPERAPPPDFFIHSGDKIYADGPIAGECPAGGGKLWKNIVTPEVSKVAETLNEFRVRYRYNMMDGNARRFNAEVPQIWQGDDHEVTNNWSGSKDLSADARYSRFLSSSTRQFVRMVRTRKSGFIERFPTARCLTYL